ncbi:MAG: prepilin-type N-terminal cleavage/methylation domain-containing protein [Candidatus Omnitrophica bacterium]|nr:prepilin-type N-terminal cleavage/methylation domain-containing protein [Candidatus Omnitrophota bacterium]
MQKVKRKKQSLKGSTLVEVMVTMLIFSILMGALYMSMNVSQTAWAVNSAQIGLQRELRKAMEQMKKEIFETGSIAINDVPANGNWYPSIRIRRPAGLSANSSIVWQANMIQYILGGADLTELHQINSVGPTVDIVAHNIQSVQFRRQSETPDVVEVALVGEDATLKGDPLTYQLNFKIELRN